STIILLFSNGCPLRPSFEGSNGSIRSHCSSERARSRDAVVIAIPQPSRQNPLTYGRHALADLHQTGGGAHRLQYREVGQGAGISLAMPPSEQPYTRRHVDPFLEGLLPDREETREALGRQFGVSGRNPFALLEHIGLDCAGAVQFCYPDQVPDVLAQAGELIPLEEQEIGARLRELRANDAASW